MKNTFPLFLLFIFSTACTKKSSVSSGTAPTPQTTPSPSTGGVPSTPSLAPSVAVSSPSNTPILKVFMGNTESFQEKLRIVDSATRTLDMAFFIIEPDPTTALLCEKILAKAQSGVRVRILFDAFNAVSSKDLLQSMILHGRGNVSIGYFRPPPAGVIDAARQFKFSTPQNLFTQSSMQTAITGQALETSRRFHHKLIIADQRVVFGGGRNLSDDYHVESDHPLNKQKQTVDKLFVDTDFSLESESIAQKALADFNQYWECTGNRECASGSPITLETQSSVSESTQAFVDRLRQASTRYSSGMATYSVRSTPHVGTFVATTFEGSYLENNQRGSLVLQTQREQPLQKAWLDSIRVLGAGEELIFHNAYVFFSPQMLIAVRDALSRGVNVTVVTNSKTSSDSQAVVEAAKPQFRTLIEYASAQNRGSFKVFEYTTPEVLHTKVTLAGKTMLIGSANADPRSEYLDTQNNLLITKAINQPTGEEMYVTYKKWLYTNIINNPQKTKLLTVNDMALFNIPFLPSFGLPSSIQGYMDKAQMYDLHKQALLDGSQGEEARQKLLTYFVQL